METQERILAKADIRKISNKKRKIVKIVYLVIVAASLIIGIISGTHTYHSESGTSVSGNTWPAHDNKYVGWFGVNFSYEGETWKDAGFGYTYWGDDSETHTGNIIWVSAMYIILLTAPLYIDVIHKRQCKNTALTLSESKIFGSYNNFLFKKSLEIPIEKVDNLTTASGLMDKLRSGVTLGICSASGVIKLHFVQNAENFVSAVMNRIDEIKEKEKRFRVVAQTTAKSSVSASDKLKDLLAMKESGLITDEEFSKKREEILTKM